MQADLIAVLCSKGADETQSLTSKSSQILGQGRCKQWGSITEEFTDAATMGMLGRKESDTAESQQYNEAPPHWAEWRSLKNLQTTNAGEVGEEAILRHCR